MNNTNASNIAPLLDELIFYKKLRTEGISKVIQTGCDMEVSIAELITIQESIVHDSLKGEVEQTTWNTFMSTLLTPVSLD